MATDIFKNAISRRLGTCVDTVPAKARLNDTIKLTPELALKLLEGNHPLNRKILDQTVTGYVYDMINGKWRNQGETIKLAIGPSGEIILIDGQHRLTAVVESGVTIEVIIVWDLPLDTINVLDCGAKRTTFQRKKMSGKNVPAKVIATCNMIKKIDAGNFAMKVTDAMTDDTMRQFGSSVDWLFSQSWVTKQFPACVLGAIAYAHSTDRSNTERFVKELSKVNLVGKTNQAANFGRQFDGLRPKVNGAKGASDAVALTHAAIKGFMAKSKATRLSYVHSNTEFFRDRVRASMYQEAAE